MRIYYPTTLGVDYEDYCINAFGSEFKRIAIADYIIGNPDRHEMNYGFIMDNKSGEIVALAPIFDYNRSLISDYDKKYINDNISGMLPNRYTILGLMRKYVADSDFVFDFTKFDSLASEFKDFGYVYESVRLRADFVSDFLI